jgi:hypothetical protein
MNYCEICGCLITDDSSLCPGCLARELGGTEDVIMQEGYDEYNKLILEGE